MGGPPNVELSGAFTRPVEAGGRNALERFVRAFHSMKYLLCDDAKYNHEDINLLNFDRAHLNPQPSL